jgi:uncharacterized integral membrane protein
MRIEDIVTMHVHRVIAICMPTKQKVRIACVLKNCETIPEPPRNAVTLLVLTIKQMTEDRMEWQREQQVFWVFTAAFFLIIVLALVVANPTPTQFVMFRWFCAIACAGMGANIPGFLSVELKTKLGKAGTLGISAVGAIGIFVIVYLLNPPALVHGGR